MYLEIIPTFETSEDLLDPEYTKTQVAKFLDCSPKTVERYLTFGSDYIPELKKYFTEDGFLNGRRILSADIIFLEEIRDLKTKFSKERVIQILKRKYA